jgi:hypothetical protein
VPNGYIEVARSAESECLHCLDWPHLSQTRPSWRVADDSSCLIIQAFGMAPIGNRARDSHCLVEWRHGYAVSYRRNLYCRVDGAGGGHVTEYDRERLLSLARVGGRGA